MDNNASFLIDSVRKISSFVFSLKHTTTLLVIVLYLLLAVYITWPLAIQPTITSVNASEEQLISYLINWNIYALTHNPLELYNTPFFHPIQDTLAFSDPLITTSVLVAPFVVIFKEPFLAYTLPTLFAFFANAFFTYLLVVEITRKKFAALIAGLLFSFSIGRLDTVEHLQVLSFYFLPLGLLFFFKYIKKPSHVNAIGVSFCFTAQVLNTIFSGYVYIFTLATFFLTALYLKKLTVKKSALLVLYGVVSALMVGAILSPYWNVSKTWNYTRSITDAWGGSAVWYEYLYPTNTSRLVDVARRIIDKSPWPAYLGFSVSILGLFSIIYYFKHLPDFRKNWHALTSLIVACLGFVLSLGPWFRLSRQINTSIPLPYLIFFYLIPGFKSMRVPQRWSHLLLFGLALFIGMVLSTFSKKINFIKLKSHGLFYGTVVTILVLVVMLEPKWPLMKSQVASASEVPKIYQWLSMQPSQVIIEIPAQHWTMPLVSKEIQRLHYHTFNLAADHSFVNGYSGFSPPTWTESIFSVKNFPDVKSIETMKQMEVDLIVVHFDDVNRLAELQGETLDAESLKRQIEASKHLEMVYQSDSSSIYRLKPEM